MIHWTPRTLGMLALLAAFATAVAACHSDEHGPCASDTDCMLGQFCNGGSCMTPAAPDADGNMDEDTGSDEDAASGDDGSDAGADDAEDDPGRSIVDVLSPTDVPSADVAPLTGGDGGSCVREVRTLAVDPTASTVYGVLAGCSAVASSTCQGDTSGPEDAYLVRVASPTGLVVSTDGAVTAIDTVLSVRDALSSSASETACNDDHDALSTSQLRTVLSAGDHYVLVDQYGGGAMGGSYQLQARTFAPAPNTACATAVVAGGTMTGTLDQGGGAPYACAPQFDGPQLFYTVAVPAGHCVRVAVTPHGRWSAIVRELDACNATACHGDATTSASDGATATLDARTTVCNDAGSPAGTVRVSIGTTRELAAGVSSDFVATFTVL